MAQLLKIILIDSLCAGAKAELVMSGNTSVTGSNGIGKSSFLKLIPVFYGATPSRLVRAGTNHKSFADWYLPNASSFIVFEYSNSEGQPRCAIMHRRGDAYAYRMVPHAWDAGLLYTDYEAGKLVAPGELSRHLSTKGLRCSQELLPRHYRKVIQYNTGSANLDDVDDANMRKEIMALRPGFSLAPKRKDFAGLDNVTLALLESQGTFDTMKQTMAELLLQENGDPSQALAMLDAQQFRSVAENLDSYLVMDGLRDDITALAEAQREHRTATIQLAYQKHHALQMTREIKAQQEQRSQRLSGLDREEEDLRASTAAKRKVQEDALGEARANLRSAQEAVDQITRQRTSYETRGIEKIRSEFETLEALNREQESKERHLQQLKKAGQDIHDLYARRAQGAKDSAADQERSTRIWADDTRKEIDSRLERRREANIEQEQAIIQEQETEAEEQRTRVAESNTRYTVEETQMSHLNSMRTSPQAQAGIDQARASASTQRKVVDACRAAEEQLARDERTLKEEQDELARQHGSLKRKRDEIAAEIESLRQMLNAGAETLLGFLRANHPDWADNIARLVPASILMRSDLNPALNEDASSDLYGVQLDLAHLPTTVATSTPELEAKIAELNAVRQGLTEDMEGLERKSRGLDERKRKLETAKAEARSATSKAQGEYESREAALEGVIASAEADHAEAKAAQAERVEIALSARKAEQQKLTNLQNEHKRHLGNMRTSGQQAIAALLEERNAVDARLTETLGRLKQTLSDELKQIDADKASSLRAQGIDPAEVIRIEAEVNALASKINKLRSYRPEVESYLAWVRDTLPQLPDRIQAVEKHSANVERLERLLKEFVDEFNAKLQSISSQRSQHIKAVAEDNQRLQTLTLAMGRLIDITPLAGEIMSGVTASDIEERVRQLQMTRSTLQRGARDRYRTIRAIFPDRGLGRTPQGAMIEQITTQALNASGDAENAWLEAAPMLLEYLEQSHPDQKVQLIMQADNLSRDLSDRHEALRDLHSKIAKIGREATAKAADVLGGAERDGAFQQARTFEQVQSIEFKVESRIRDLSFWGALEDYQQQYRRWAAMGENVLPTAGFMEALRKLERHIREGALTAKLSDCFSVSVTCREQGRTKVANNNSELVSVSSTGVTKIIVTMIYVSLFELLRRDADFQMSIPIDEALELEAKNYIGMVDYFNSRGISMLACFPGGAPELLRQFPNRYTLQKRGKTADHRDIIVKEYTADADSDLDELDAMLADPNPLETAAVDAEEVAVQ
ncbi:ATP-binding protein (plasmid) [Pseudomonas aeruginosa]|uniref:ATP-binding protein n=1 Tax=Pseudomonas aeruginosa TaxID=287 RepID=UPI004046B764